MSSVLASTADTQQGSAFYIVITALVHNGGSCDIFNENTTANTTLFDGNVPVGTVLRDLGTSVRVPASSATNSYVLRKVQVLTPAGAPGSDTDSWQTFYVRVTPKSNGDRIKVARLSA